MSGRTFLSVYENFSYKAEGIYVSRLPRQVPQNSNLCTLLPVSGTGTSAGTYLLDVVQLEQCALRDFGPSVFFLKLDGKLKIIKLHYFTSILVCFLYSISEKI
jgi:hypothetical protein